MGPTGSGKSSFISSLAPGAARVGHKLVSCTAEVQLVDAVIDGVHVILIDTPGFDDTHNSDTNTLRLIANFLEISYQQKQLLSGIIYFHRIADNRVGGVTAKNMRMFRSLCGDAALKNVVLCTTMWDLVSRSHAEQREAELKADFWKDMISSGSSAVRHDNTAASALAVVRPMLGRQGVAVQLQRELASGKQLQDTASGGQLNKELRQLQEMHRLEMAALKEEMELASGAKLRQIENELKEESNLLKKAQQEQTRLLTERSTEIEKLKQELRQKKKRGC
ncbi:P-loop containing nucleoside triphosphate hydrolase protein [Auricularia subglabra TFB-10046 SS5]|nr:P-loop containing nucleoside triphosphate hydrolase protein [Auricularia subglabra TFB-10046 SS5]